jgi:hypothetical protein
MRVTLSTPSVCPSVYLSVCRSLGNAALLVPGVIIKLTRGDKRGAMEVEELSGAGHYEGKTGEGSFEGICFLLT